jgi:hypothetical protein
MISKTKQNKLALKHFIKYVNETYGDADFTDGESGMMDFMIDNEMFCIHRNYLDVLTYKMNGERGYEKQLEIESQLQEALESIKQKVEDETITE